MILKCYHKSTRNKSPRKTCIIHIGEGQEEGDIKSLQESHKIWHDIKSAAAKKKAWQSSSKCTTVISNLPETCFSHHGYHVSCYRRFTAIPTSLQPVKAESPGISSAVRKSNSRELSTSSPCLPKLCLFCNKFRKKVGRQFESLGKCMTIDAEVAIRNAAELLKDDSLLLKVDTSGDFIAKEVMYHHSCRKSKTVL